MSAWGQAWKMNVNSALPRAGNQEGRAWRTRERASKGTHQTIILLTGARNAAGVLRLLLLPLSLRETCPGTENLYDPSVALAFTKRRTKNQLAIYSTNSFAENARGRYTADVFSHNPASLALVIQAYERSRWLSRTRVFLCLLITELEIFGC